MVIRRFSNNRVSLYRDTTDAVHPGLIDDFGSSKCIQTKRSSYYSIRMKDTMYYISAVLSFLSISLGSLTLRVLSRAIYNYCHYLRSRCFDDF